MNIVCAFFFECSDQEQRCYIVKCEYICRNNQIKFVIMGQMECCGKRQATKDATDVFKNLQEFYDPFSEMRNKVIREPQIIKKHAPANANILTSLPFPIIKKESIYHQKFQQPVTLSPNSYLLPPIQSKGIIHFGQWLNGQKEGYGKTYFPDGSYYSGSFKNGKAEGKGRLHHPNGDYYNGQWKDDKSHGIGEYQSAIGGKYEGQWLQDKRHGQGRQTWPDCTIFQGKYELNQKVSGTFYYCNGQKYTGEVKNNKKDGKGQMVFRDGKVYSGMWLRDQMHGQGVFTWPTGERFEGMYYEGQRHGRGKLYYIDGSVFEGEWKFGKRQGPGVLTQKDGKKIESMWKDDQKA